MSQNATRLSPSPSPSSRSSRRPRRFLGLLRLWVATVSCLLLLIVVSPADELYDFAATDLRGTPSLVNLRTARRSVSRSRRRAVQRRQKSRARRASARRESVRIVRARKRLRVPASAFASAPQRPRIAASRAPRSTRSTRSSNRRRVAQASRATSRGGSKQSTARSKNSSSLPSSSTSPQRAGQKAFPARLPPPVVLARRGEEGDAVSQRGARIVAGEEAEEVRQNLSLAFVTPRNAPAVGVRLVARVVPSEGAEVTYSNLKTDLSGRIKLSNIALPAAIDLDFAAQTPLSSSADEEDELPLEGEPDEWDFQDASRATLLLEKPLGHIRSALAPERARLAVALDKSRGAGKSAPRLWGPSASAREMRVVSAVSRMRVFEGEAAAIVLERQVIDLDITAPPGSQLSSPALEGAPVGIASDSDYADSMDSTDSTDSTDSMSTGEAITVPASGRISLRLPREVLEEGPIPIRVARELAGGEAEAVIASYPTDAYALNLIAAPPLRLVRLSQLDLAGRVGVMGTRANVARRLGDLRGPDNKNNALGQISPLADGSEWWIYPTTGIAFKMRFSPDAFSQEKDAPMFVERVRLFSVNAGSFGTVAVGTSVEQMRASLGRAQVENDARTPSDALSTPGRIDTWLEGGLRVCHDGDQVLWLESARPNVLLTGGTTAFVGRTRARLFIESFKGHPGIDLARIDLASLTSVRKYLEQAHAVETVSSREQADLVLRARVSGWREDKGEPSHPLPHRYNSVLRLTYSLLDAGTGRALVQNKQAEGRAKSELSPESLGDRGPGALERAMQKIAAQGAARAVRAAFDALVADVNRLSDFSLRVTKIDYAAGTLQLNAGRAQGLRASQSDPDDFQITVAGAALPEDEQADAFQFFTARVIAVSQSTAVCRLLHVNHFTRGGRDAIDEEPAPEMVRRLPDPATGVVAARPWTPLRPVSPAEAVARRVLPPLAVPTARTRTSR